MKLVNESLFEFKKGMDPIDSLGLGRRKIIEDWLNSMKVRYYTINDDYSIDVDDSVDLSGKRLTEIPEFIQFDIVEGEFACGYNELTSLKGCPKIVKKTFMCSRSQLSSLEGCPKEVGGDFWCRYNKVNFTEDDIRKICDVKGRIYAV